MVNHWVLPRLFLMLPFLAPTGFVCSTCRHLRAHLLLQYQMVRQVAPNSVALISSFGFFTVPFLFVSTFLTQHDLLTRVPFHALYNLAVVAGCARLGDARLEGKSTKEKAKLRAAYAAVDTHVKDGQVLGIGSGSTVVYAVDVSAALKSACTLLSRMRSAGVLNVWFQSTPCNRVASFGCFCVLCQCRRPCA